MTTTEILASKASSKVVHLASRDGRGSLISFCSKYTPVLVAEAGTKTDKVATCKTCLKSA